MPRTRDPSDAAERRAAADAAEALGRLIDDQPSGPGSLVPLRVGEGAEPVRVPSSALSLLRDALGELSRGHEVELLPHGGEVGTEFAARLLGVSRPYFVKLLEEERAMPFHKVGRDRRVALSDVLAYRRQLRARRSRALTDLVRESEEIGLYDDEA